MEDTSVKNQITEQHIKEVISKGYIDSLIAYAGFNSYNYDKDYGLDGGFEEVKIRGGRHVSGGFKVDFQLKASSNIEIKNNLVIYDLEVKNYNDLIDTDVGTPRILFLYMLPKDEHNYISVNIDKTEFQNCAVWISLKGQEFSNNEEKKRIKIPIENIVTRDSLKNIMIMAKGGKL